METENRLLGVDAFALLFRGYYALINRPLLTSDGRNTSAVYGFMGSLLSAMDELSPTHVVVAYDLGGPTFRQELDGQYKANREATPEAVVYGADAVKRMLEALGVLIASQQGFEADDMLGSVAQTFASDQTTVYLFTQDKDYQQLLGPHTVMHKPLRNAPGNRPFTQADLLAKYPIAQPGQFRDILALWGDASDNVPGVPGIGEKTAAKLVGKYGGIEQIYANIGKLTPKLQKALKEHKEQLLKSYELVGIRRNLPLDFQLSDCRVGPPDCRALAVLFSELQFGAMAESIMRHFLTEAQVAQVREWRQGSVRVDKAPAADTSNQATQADEQLQDAERAAAGADCARVADVDTLPKLADAIAEAPWVALALAQEGDRVLGVSICYEVDQTVYCPLPFLKDLPAEQRALLNGALGAQPARILVGYDLKTISMVLAGLELYPKGQFEDLMVMDYLIDPDKNRGLDYHPGPQLAQFLAAQGEASGDLEARAANSCAVTLWPRRLDRRARLVEAGVQGVYESIEAPLRPVLAAMERTGVAVNLGVLDSLRGAFNTRLEALRSQVLAYSPDKSINIDSPKQVGELLFDVLHLSRNPKKTHSGTYSTSEIELRKYAHLHPIIAQLLEYREVRKQLNTYVDALPGLVNPATGRIHTHFNQAVAATGRLSSSNPNLQNIPVRNESGRLIREAFVSSFEGGELLSADYSQIELRLMAHMSGDKNMVEDFLEGHDIHAATASRIFGIPLQEVTPAQRKTAKKANFGMIYGISAFGLSQQLEVKPEEAKKLMDDYFATYPGVAAYMRAEIEKAKQRGYAETLFGRKRWIPDLLHGNANLRKAAERNAINAPIQGTAADIIKKAMVTIFRTMQVQALRSRMIIQVHDELIFDVYPGELEALQAIVKPGMEQVCQLKVPLIVDMAHGPNWGTL